MVAGEGTGSWLVHTGEGGEGRGGGGFLLGEPDDKRAEAAGC